MCLQNENAPVDDRGRNAMVTIGGAAEAAPQRMRKEDEEESRSGAA